MPIPNLTSALANLSHEKTLIEFAQQERRNLYAHWNPQRGGRHWMQDHTALMDALLKRLFTLSLERTGNNDSTRSATQAIPQVFCARAKSPTYEIRQAKPYLTEGIALLATGGYGQRLLAPGSDLDVTFLSAREEDPPVLRAMFSLISDVLMTGLRLKVGYFYCTLGDIAGGTLDHQRQTSFLDARLIGGDSHLFARFDRLFLASLQTADFLFRNEGEQLRRRARPENALYSTEPDVKNGTGGLRDLQTASWMGRVRFHSHRSLMGSGESLWRDLVRRRVITRDDLKQFTEAREFLLTVRCGLHRTAGDRRDLLSQPRQEEVAQQLNLTDTENRPDVQGLMHRYYTAAAHIARISDKIVTRCLESPIELDNNNGLSSVRRRVAITNPKDTEAVPLWPIEALDACQTYNLELALATEEAIAQYLQDKPFAETERLREAGHAFLSLLSKPGDSVETLRRMRRTGLLAVLLPEFDRCLTLVPYDPSHVHTVGEHSLRVLANLLELRDTPPDDSPVGHYRAVLKTIEDPLPLYLSALLHDIGKQWPTNQAGERRPHEETGAERVPEILSRLGAKPDIIADVEFLVRYHLVLATTSRLRDLGQPETIREVARTVSADATRGDPVNGHQFHASVKEPIYLTERLKMLYLLTYADTRAVGPGVLTDMNIRLLTELFERTEAALQVGKLEPLTKNTPNKETAHLTTVRERLQRQLSRNTAALSQTVPAEMAQEHIQRMPTAYLLNTPPEAMAKHLTMITRLRAGEPVVFDTRTTENSQTEITVVTWDDPEPGLLAKLTGALVVSDVPLHRAQVFTRDAMATTFPDDAPGLTIAGKRIAIDTLLVDYRGRSLTVDKRRAVEEAIRAVLDGTKTVAELLAQRRRAFSLVQPIRSFSVDDTASSEYTLLDVETPNEIGVVYRLATLFNDFQWNIHAARVTAWGGNARCAFYLTDREGGLLSAALVTERLHRHGFARPIP